MKTKIIDNWEVELTNDRGDTLTLKGEWYADFFKEYESKQLIIANVIGRRGLLLDFAEYSENDKTSTALDECVDNYLDSIKQ